MKITPVILSGGSGTRLWPISRSLEPKQFSTFLDDSSLFQKTALRTNRKANFENPIVICNNEHRFRVAEELANIKIKPKSIILESVGKNTAPAIAIAALDVLSTNSKEDDLILVMPSDHIIKDKAEFINQVKNAKIFAQDGYLTTFGIVPKRPETGYGYIEKDQAINNDKTGFLVKKFIEKPNQKTAQKFVKDPNYLWNSGIFLFKASVYLENLQKFQSQIFINCCNSYNNASKDLDFIRLAAKDFEKCTNISVDYAVMEKAKKVAVLDLDADWSDVGSWQSIAEINQQDKNGNSLIGDAITLDSKNCYINSPNYLTTTIGVENLIIIALKDALLVANKNNSQDVKKLYEILKDKKRDECNSHPKVMRPWGSFEVIEVGERFKVKKIIVNPKASLSLQMHNHRAEHWIVVKGIAKVTCGNKSFTLGEDKSTYIPLGKKHRLENKGQIDLELIEVQTGNYLGEDDIIRFSDIYGR